MKNLPWCVLAALSTAACEVGSATGSSYWGGGYSDDPGSVLTPVVQPIALCHVAEGAEGTTAIRVDEGEVEAHLAHGDRLPSPVLIPLQATASASSQYLDQSPQSAFDGNESWGWNSGDYPVQWIEIDFKEELHFAEVRARVDQFPLIAKTEHDISLDGVGAFIWSGVTSHLDWLSATLDVPRSARVVRITTTQSPSWVAWLEVELTAC